MARLHQGFNATSATSVSFSVPEPSGDSAQFAVTPGTTATVAITTNAGHSNTESFGVTAASGSAPAITSISPTSGPAGTVVTLTGTGFGATQGSSYVGFHDNGINWGAPGNVAAFMVDSWSATSVSFSVPEPSGDSAQFAVTPATTATLAITTNAGTSNSESFSVSAPTGAAPAITSLSPGSGGATTVVTITGTGFGATQGSSYVGFHDNGINWGAPGNAAAFSVDSWSATSITFSVPSPSGPGGAYAVTPGSSASVQVVSANGASNTESFSVT